MIVVAVLSFAFIFGVLFLSFAGAEPEVKVFGFAFFISFILVEPLFGGMLSIHAPVPMDSENTIDIPPVVLKTWLGHTNIHITLDTYADVFNRMNFDAADKFDDLMEKLDLGAVKKEE